jgi:Heterokaryon incompatibility protein (HET)
MDPLLQDHFRLLYLEHGDKDSAIHCRLATFELQSAPAYEALSYTWGEAVLSHEITCNGSSLQVTSNLHDALQYLRPIDGERIMWIDAVCINQTNPQERTAQVGIMKNIYSKSDHVVIWLGKDTDDDETAFAILEQYRKLFAEHGQLDIGPMETVAYKLALPAEESKDWTALIKLFQKPWFQRIWVIQEAVVCLPTFPFLHFQVSKPLSPHL